MPDRTPAEALVARLSGVDDPAERVRIVAEALEEAMMAGVTVERDEWVAHLRHRATEADRVADGWARSGDEQGERRVRCAANVLWEAARFRG